MQFPRSGQLDERRRRVLTDEVIGNGADASSSGSVAPSSSSSSRRPAANSRLYGDAALIDRQPRVTDFVPQRYAILLLLFAAGLAIVGGLEVLYAWMPEIAAKTTDGTIAAFDLDSEGSLAVWFSSTTLMMAGLVAFLIYSIRRHKADDYHGRYRIWLWATLCWFGMSIDESASLHEGFKGMMTHLTGQRGFGDGSIWWVGGYSLVLSVIGLRLVFEMRACRGSTAALWATAAAYATAVVTQLGLIMPDGGARSVMLEEGCEMVGNLFLLLSMTLHARYVIQEANGRLPAKAAKPAKDKSQKPSRADETKTVKAEEISTRWWFRRGKADPAHETPPAPSAPQRDREPATVTKTIQPGAETKEEDYDYLYEDGPRGGRKSKPAIAARDEEGHERRLSKAERKALRRQQRERERE